MSDLTDTELALALNGECHTVEVVVWLAREVKRSRDAQRAASTHEDVRGVTIRALDRHLVGTAALGVAIRNRIAESIADEVVGLAPSAKGNKPPRSQGMPEVFPFVTSLHREVVLRNKDGESQDVEMTPDEAESVASALRAAAACAKAPDTALLSQLGLPLLGFHYAGLGVHGNLYRTDAIKLSGNAPLEIFTLISPLHHKVVLRHKDGESQDIELTPDEADRVADQLWAAANTSRVAKVET
jgi:hypothetical protein